MTFKANNLSCTRQQRRLFGELSFELNAGNILLVEGDNGSGKSSLLRLLVGLSTPDTGEILWHNQCIQQARDEFVKHVHYVGHTNGIKLGLTVAENLQLASCLQSLPSRGLYAGSSVTILEKFNLTNHLHTPAKHLSAGQQRKLALAKLFIFPKTLWIIDEPVTALDKNSQHNFLSMLETHLQQGGMCIMTSHHAMPFQQIKPLTLRLSS